MVGRGAAVPTEVAPEQRSPKVQINGGRTQGLRTRPHSFSCPPRVPGGSGHARPDPSLHRAGGRPGQLKLNSAVNYQKREGRASRGTAQPAQGRTRQPAPRGAEVPGWSPAPASPADSLSHARPLRGICHGPGTALSTFHA